jgi:hypothetical protein
MPACPPRRGCSAWAASCAASMPSTFERGAWLDG